MKRYKRGTLLYGDEKIQVNLYKQDGDVFVILEGDLELVTYNPDIKCWVIVPC